MADVEQYGEGGKVRRTTFAVSVCFGFLIGMLMATPSSAAPVTSIADLQAATRAIGFLNNLPHDGVVVIGVVYANGDSDRANAAATASQLAAMPGPSNAIIRTVLVPSQNFAKAAGRLDIALLMPMPPAVGKQIADAVRARRIVSISTDPACLDTHCCVLMVHAEQRVEIVLDTATASDVGAQFPNYCLVEGQSEWRSPALRATIWVDDSRIHFDLAHRTEPSADGQVADGAARGPCSDCRIGREERASAS